MGAALCGRRTDLRARKGRRDAPGAGSSTESQAARAAYRSARNTGGMPASERSQPGVVLLSADPHHLPRTAQALSRAARRGDLVRLSPGVYVETDRWLLAPPWDRHRMVIAAHSLSRRGTAVFCHLTALELHRLPLPHVPRALHVRASSRGRAGTSGPASAYVNEERTRQAADQLSRDPGHRHLSGPLPALPAVRRHGNLLGWGPVWTAPSGSPSCSPMERGWRRSSWIPSR